jgi:hypothetical protein
MPSINQLHCGKTAKPNTGSFMRKFLFNFKCIPCGDCFSFILRLIPALWQSTATYAIGSAEKEILP